MSEADGKLPRRERRDYKGSAEALAKVHERTRKDAEATRRFLRAQALGWRALAFLAACDPEEWRGRLVTYASFTFNPYGGNLEKIEAEAERLVKLAQHAAAKAGLFDTMRGEPVVD